MRKLRVVFTTIGGVMPALLATMLAPAVDACADGAELGQRDLPHDDATTVFFQGDESVHSPWEAAVPDQCPTYIVELPSPGTAAEPGQLCAVPSPVSSN